MEENIMTPMTAAAAAAVAAPAAVMKRLHVKPAAALTGIMATERVKIIRGLGFKNYNQKKESTSIICGSKENF